MIPMERKSSRHSARTRLCHAWIIVSCDQLRKASHRQRMMFLKSTDWLEATIESITLKYGDSAEQQEKARATSEAYRELQREVETLYAGGKHMREDVENLKVKLAALLDLCGIKDADIPAFDEPDCNRQSLITSFGTMSKKSPHSRPRRKEPVLSDPSVYGDQLLDYLMAQTDSDTSLSPPEDSVASANAATDSELQKDNEQMSPLGSPKQHSSSPSQAVHDELTPVFQKGGNQTHEHQNLVSPPAVGGNGGRRAPSHCTTDSGVVGSDHSHVAVAMRQQPVEADYGQQSLEAEFSQQSLEDNFSQQSLEDDFSQQSLEDDFSQRSVDSFVPQVQNRTSGSTPELPASQSSTCLDILYASMFDSIEDPDSVKFPIQAATAAAHCQSSGHSQTSQVHQEVNDYNKQERYTCTTTPGTTERTLCHTPIRSLLCEEHSPAEDTPVAPSRYPLKSQLAIPDRRRSCQSVAAAFCEPLVVCLPPEPGHKHCFNLGKPHKHCQDDLVDVESCMESQGPPLPPRRPVTDRKMRPFTGQPVCAELSNTGRHGIKSYYSEKKVRRHSQPTACDVAHNSCSQQITHCEQCRPGTRSSPRHRSAQSRYSLQDVPEVSMVTSPKGRNKEQSRKPQSSLARSGSASKRRRGNDHLPVQSSHQDRPVRSARQRLKFISPSRSSDHNTDSDCDCKQAFPVICPSDFDQAVQPRKVQSLVCSMLKHKDHKPHPPQQFSQGKPTAERYDKQVRVSDVLTSCDNLPASTAAASSSMARFPNRDKVLLDRQKYYSDFSVDRHIEWCPSNKENESQYSLERSVRKVEGSECSPSFVVFKVPPTNMRAPRTADQRLSRSKVSSKGVSAGSKVLSGGTLEGYHSSYRSDSSSLDYPDMSSSSDSYHQTHTRSSLSSRSSSKSSSKVASRKSNKYTSHPMASSTLIFDSSYSLPVEKPQASPRKDPMPSPHRLNIVCPERGTVASLDSGSVITWTINEDFPDDRDRSHSQSVERSISAGKRQSMHIDRGNVMTSETVHKMPLTVSHSRETAARSGTTAPAVPASLDHTSDRHIIAASQSYLKAANSSSNQQCSDPNNQACKSLKRNNAQAVLLVCTEGGDVSGYVPVPQVKHISASEPDLRYCCPQVEEEAEYSLVPSDADSDSLPHRSSASSSSPCTAARCRPRVVTRQFAGEPFLPEECRSLPDQDLMDSILTDSPRSVNSSGIYAPHNSYTSPVNSIGSPNGNSTTVSSSLSADTHPARPREYSIVYTSPVNSIGSPNGHSTTVSSLSTDTHQVMPHEYPIVPPPPPYNQSLTERSTPARADLPSENKQCPRPFTPLPHVNQIGSRPTRNQGVTAEAPSTPHGPPAVVEASSREPAIVPPPVVTPGPPKNKNSLVRKLKQFGSHFTRKPDKIQTLANL